jgi:hypothetical protein
MVYKVSVKSETLSWEEPSSDDPDMSLRKEETRYTATCFELGLSAESIDWKASALSELKEKVSKKTGIALKEIEFQVIDEDDEWSRKKETAELKKVDSDNIPNEESSSMSFNVIVNVDRFKYEITDKNNSSGKHYEFEVIWTATCHELGLSEEEYEKIKALDKLKNKIAMNKKIPVEKVELRIIKEETPDPGW